MPGRVTIVGHKLHPRYQADVQSILQSHRKRALLEASEAVRTQGVPEAGGLGKAETKAFSRVSGMGSLPGPN